MNIPEAFINEFCEQLEVRLLLKEHNDPVQNSEIIKLVKKTFDGMNAQNELPPLPIDMGDIFPNIRGVNPPNYPLL